MLDAEKRQLSLVLHAQIATRNQEWGDPVSKFLGPQPEDEWAAAWAFMGEPKAPPQPELVETYYTSSMVVSAVPTPVPWDPRGRGR